MQELLQLAEPVRALAKTFKGNVYPVVSASTSSDEKFGLVRVVEQLRTVFDGLDSLISRLGEEVEAGVEQEFARLAALAEPIFPVIAEKRLRFTVTDSQPVGLTNQTRIVLALFLAQAKSVQGRVDGQ